MSRLSFARYCGSGAMILISLSVIAWSQACVSTYMCAGLPCHGLELELPPECDLDACERYVDVSPIEQVWQPDEQCFSRWGHSRCKAEDDAASHQQYVSEQPLYGSVEWGCGQRTCCSQSTTPPEGFVAGVPDIYYVCTEAEIHDGIICAQQDTCDFFAPVFLVASIWAVFCTLVLCGYLSKINIIAHRLRATFDEQTAVGRGVQMVVGERALDQSPGRAGAPPMVVASEVVTGTPVASGVPAIIVDGVPTTASGTRAGS